MKTIKFFSIIALLIGFSFALMQCAKEDNKFKNSLTSSPLQNRNSGIGSSCIGETPSPCYDGVYTWSIRIPDYPECEFIVTLNYFVCLGEGGGRIHMGDFDYTVNYGCTEFYEDWENAIRNGSEDQFYTNFNQQVWTEVTKNLLSSQTTHYWFYAELEYNVGSCIYLCERDALMCGDACCQRTNEWEKDQQGNWILTKKGEIIHTGDPCPDYPIRTCPPDVLQSASCFDNCASLDF